MEELLEQIRKKMGFKEQQVTELNNLNVDLKTEVNELKKNLQKVKNELSESNARWEKVQKALGKI